MVSKQKYDFFNKALHLHTFTPFYYAHSNMYMYYVRSKNIKLRKIKIWVNPPINIFIADAAVVLYFLFCYSKFI